MNLSPIDINEIAALSPLQPEGWVDIVPVFDFYIRSSFCFPIKATIDQQITGIGVIIIHNDVAWLAHIIVHPNHRCKGIGEQIVQTLIERANQNQCSTIYLIATEMGEPIYTKAGFITETEYLVHKNITKTDWIISNNIHPYKEQYKEHFMKLDREIYGEGRMMHLEGHLANSLVYRQGDTVEGYYLPTLQEGLIIASTETAGIELLKLYLKQNDRVVIPKENQAAQKFLQETGVGEVKTIKRMRLGEARKTQFVNIYNRIGGNIG